MPWIEKCTDTGLCGYCFKKIRNGQLQIGVKTSTGKWLNDLETGEYKLLLIDNWYHVYCFLKSGRRIPAVSNDLWGLNVLSNSEIDMHGTS